MVQDIADPLKSLKLADDKPTSKWPVNLNKLRDELVVKGFGGRVVARCDPGEVYKAAIYRWAENFEGLPALVVFPQTEDEVSIVVSFSSV
jgi:hypothetical protein